MDVGRVVGRAEHPHRRAVGVAHHPAARGHPAHGPVGVHDAIVGLVLTAALDGPCDRRLDARAVIRVQARPERVDVLGERLAA